MDYALQQHGTRTQSEFATEATQKRMDVAACSALSWALFSAGLCALDAGSLGISLFLLVPVRVGGPHIRPAGPCLSQAEKLRDLHESETMAGRVVSMLPRRRWERRCNVAAAYRHVT
jgi:hypothetical protein